MRIVLQRVSQASVSVKGETVGEIGPGLLFLVGVGHGDTFEAGRKLVQKALDLRIFEDEAGKMNLSFRDLARASADSVGILLVSQFTLYADTRKGRRPSFVDAADPSFANELLASLVDFIRNEGILCESGQFGAHMAVSLVNDGPVTILLDSAGFGSA
jgi:D-tyrosyl-tRNA(Tyr) deacylase